MHRAAITGLLVLAALLALPVAEGAKPIREVFGPSQPGVIPAGEGCAFDVLWQPSPDAFHTETYFSDGRVQTIGHGNPTLTNLETKKSYVQTSRYEITEVLDDETNDVLGEGHGRFLAGFLPGDQGPYGEVGADGANYGMIGNFRYTFDLDTLTLTSFQFSGSATDVCAILAAA